jgi:hypothetical protein
MLIPERIVGKAKFACNWPAARYLGTVLVATRTEQNAVLIHQLALSRFNYNLITGE